MLIMLIHANDANKKERYDGGFSLLEGITALGIVALVVVIVIGEIIFSQNISARSVNTGKATDLAREAIEAVKDIRGADFFDLVDGTHGLKIEDGRWALAVGAPDVVDNLFTRELRISSPAIDRKLVEAAVVWPDNNEIKLVTEFRNWFPTYEDWSNPQYSGDFNLTPENSGSNNHKVKAVLTKGNYVYFGSENSNGKEFFIFDIVKAPAIVMKGSLDLDGNSNNISVYGDYAFIASGSQSQELQVISIINKSQPQLVGSFNLSGQDDGLASDINSDGSLLALGRDKGNLYIFNISNPALPSLLGQITLSSSGKAVNAVRISGNYVLAAVGDGTLRMVNISNPSLPAQVASLQLTASPPANSCGNALSLDITGTRAYVGCASSNGFYIVDITNPASPLILSTSYWSGSNADIFHISFAATEKLIFLMTSDSAKDFQVWDVSNDLSPTNISTVNLRGTPSQADYSPLVQKMFVGLISDPEIQIVAPDILETPPA